MMNGGVIMELEKILDDFCRNNNFRTRHFPISDPLTRAMEIRHRRNFEEELDSIQKSVAVGLLMFLIFLTTWCIL
jgi:hypothetical protein